MNLGRTCSWACRCCRSCRRRSRMELGRTSRTGSRRGRSAWACRRTRRNRSSARLIGRTVSYRRGGGNLGWRITDGGSGGSSRRCICDRCSRGLGTSWTGRSGLDVVVGTNVVAWQSHYGQTEEARAIVGIGRWAVCPFRSVVVAALDLVPPCMSIRPSYCCMMLVGEELSYRIKQ